jgi:putative hydrolase of the HAD superfamily
MRIPSAIVFDAVGTLLHADPPVADVYHLAGWQHGSQLSREEVARRFRAAFAASEAGDSGAGDASAGGALVRQPTSESRERDRWRRIVVTVFDDVPDPGGTLFHTLWRHFAEPASWRLFDDAAHVLGELAERDMRLAIASNFDRRLRAVVQADSLLRRCERCFISSELGCPKPDRRFFDIAAAQLNLPSNDILLVGDDWTNDILGARAAGWQTVWLDRGGTGAPETGIRSLHELLPLVTR